MSTFPESTGGFYHVLNVTQNQVGEDNEEKDWYFGVGIDSLGMLDLRKCNGGGQWIKSAFGVINGYGQGVIHN